MENHKELDVWKKSVALTTELYALTSRFPDAERYGLASQIRRAATSIAANIAEGWGRGSTAEYIQFLTVSRGSLMELETHLIVARNLSFLKPDEFAAVSREVENIGKMLNRLISVLRGRKRERAPETEPRTPKPESRTPNPEPRTPRFA
jgi:four helix bundle protein